MKGKSKIKTIIGTKDCAICNSNKNIIQVENDRVIKGLPLIEIRYICEKCAKKHKLVSEDYIYKTVTI